MITALCIALGFMVGWLFRRAWCEASEADRLEMLRGRGREGR